MGSKSDLETLREAIDLLKKGARLNPLDFGDLRLGSAYREEDHKRFENNSHMLISATIIAAVLIFGIVSNAFCSPDSNIVLTKTVTPVQGVCNEFLVKLGITATAANKPVDVIFED